MDELNFSTIPFAFPFFGRQNQTLTLSLNGVAYADSTPEDMDYRNSNRAPLNSIAALHTDLSADDSPYGVRYRISDDGSVLTVKWLMHHFSSPANGDVAIWLDVHKNGQIRSCVSIASEINGQVAKSSTMGVSGQSAAESALYAYDDASKIRSNICVLYTPDCSSTQDPSSNPTSPIVSKVRLAAAKRGMPLEPGQRISIRATGQGSGSMPLTAKIDGRSCNQSRAATLNNGKASLSTLISKLLATRSATRISVQIGEAQASKTVAGRTAPITRSKSRKLNDSSFNRICNTLFKYLR